VVSSVHESFSDFTESEWNALERGDFVFGDHRFLAALENSGCLGRRTGWFPQIQAVRIKDRLVGALPVFKKTNSYGEYIFDWAWANAAEHAGLAYYPKLVAAIPFTPATGPKFFLSQNTHEAAAARELLLTSAQTAARSWSSLHFLFETPLETEALREKSFLIRHSFQYHWHNRGWTTFEDFLSALRSKRRSEIRRERSVVEKSGVTISRLTGDALTPEHAEMMAAFYLSTIRKMGGQNYLTKEFFKDVFLRMKDSLLFVFAQSSSGEPIAGALNFYRGRTLFGRYWGCVDDFKNLHFEVCYYQAIDWCLERGFELFEAGAQGEHKFNRGFTPHLTLSAHEIHHPGLRSAVSDFLESEKVSIDEIFKDYRLHDPFQRLD
jgi:predicted N-acyltransferase